MSRISYNLRVIWACMKKDIRGFAYRPHLSVILGVFLPVNFLILFSLFVLSGWASTYRRCDERY